MRHDIRIDGHGYRLRPVAGADADFIAGLRRDPALSRYLHPVSPHRRDQLAWLDNYFARDGDYYFVVERRLDDASEGTVALYDHNPGTGSAEWGRWILGRGSLAAVESAWLIYRVAFDQLGLETVYCRTVADNAPVLSFHQSCGLVAAGRLRGHFRLADGSHDAVEHRLTRDRWPQVEAALSARAARLADRLGRGDGG